MARAYLNWDQKELAERCGISISTVRYFEGETRDTGHSTIAKIQTCLELAGITFLESGGLEPTDQQVIRFEGRDGFVRFMDDVYETMKQQGGIYRVSNVNEANWLKWIGDREAAEGQKRMSALDGVSARILVRGGDRLLVATTYAEYSALPAAVFHDHVSSYVYGDKYAIIRFEPDNVFVTLLHDAEFAGAQADWFDAYWETLPRGIGG